MKDVKVDNSQLEFTSLLDSAMKKYDPSHRKYSRVLGKSTSNSSLDIDLEKLEKLADTPQDSLQKILEINAIVRKYINLDDIIGKVEESIRVNVNTEYRLSYSEIDNSSENHQAEYTQAKKLINSFNDSVNIRRIIRTGIPRVYTEGNIIMYLRHENTSYNVDIYPLDIAEISPFEINGEPVVVINMDKLKEKLSSSTSQYRTRKRKNLFFDSVGEEIRKNYPSEVYKAYQNKDPYAVLDHKYTGVVRINTLGYRYGLSAIFRALPLAVLLNTFMKTDDSISRIKAKRILVQLFDKSLTGKDGSKTEFRLAAFAHEELFNAVKSSESTIYTALPGITDVKFVESKATLTDIDTVTYYQNKELSTLGISFLSSSNSSQNVASASISLDQLMRIINSISESFEDVFRKWYQQILMDNKFNLEFLPKIQILDSEALSLEIKKDMAKLLYTYFNISLETSLSILGIDINDEKAKRVKENSEGMDEIFSPRSTAFTSSGKGEVAPENNSVGRPSGNRNDTNTNVKKQEYDSLRQEAL